MDDSSLTRSISMFDYFSSCSLAIYGLGILLLLIFFSCGLRGIITKKENRRWSFILILIGVIFSLFPISWLILNWGITYVFYGMDGGTGISYGVFQTDLGSSFIFIGLHLFLIPISALLALVLQLLAQKNKLG